MSGISKRVSNLVLSYMSKMLCISTLIGVSISPIKVMCATNNPCISFEKVPDRDMASIEQVCNAVNAEVMDFEYRCKENKDSTSATKSFDYFFC